MFWGHQRPFEALWICPVLTDQKWSNWAEILHGGLKWKYKYTSNNVLRPSEAIRGHQRPFEAVWICRFWEYLKACLKGFQTSDWAYILCGWLFSRPSFHEQVFEAKVESIVRPLEVFRGHFETKVTFDIMTLGEVICLSYMEASWVWGCSRLPITIINSVWEYSSRSIELIFCVVGSFYTTIFMSIFFRPRSTPKQRSLKVTHGNLRPRSNLIAHESCCIKRDSHTKYEPNQTLKYSQT